MPSAICFSLDLSKISSSGNVLMVLEGVSLTKLNNRAAESAEQDQCARIYLPILLYTILHIYKFNVREQHDTC